jgi:hypothetical protein
MQVKIKRALSVFLAPEMSKLVGLLLVGCHGAFLYLNVVDPFDALIFNHRRREDQLLEATCIFPASFVSPENHYIHYIPRLTLYILRDKSN